MKAMKHQIIKQQRIKAWERMMQDKGMGDAKQRDRMDSGGYRCPGSNKRT